MKIGDKVRFLNDVGGGKVTAFRPGGIVLVEDEDGFDMPMPMNEVVVIEEEAPKEEKKKPAPKVTYGEAPIKEKAQPQPQDKKTLNGREYLQSKTVVKETEAEVDEQLEARVVRIEQALQQQTQTLLQLEAALQKAESRIALLEAENNLRKNERMMARKAKPQPKPKPEMPKNIEDLQIL